MTPEHREAISRGQMERHRRQREQQDRSAVTMKKCTQCGERKRVPEDYYMRRRKLKCGEVVRYAAGECLECAAERRRRWKATYIEEHGEQAWKDRQRRYNASRDPEAKRRYNREWWRLTHGMGIRIWRKYEHEAGQHLGSVRVSAVALRRWWREDASKSQRSRVRADECLARMMRYILSGEQENVEISSVDAIGVAAGDPGLLSRLYPD